MRKVSYIISAGFRNYVFSNCRAEIGRCFYNDCFLGTYLKIFVPSLTQNFMNYAALLSKNTEDSNDHNKKGRAVSKKQAKDPMISLIKENDERSMMYLSEAEKYAKRKSMILVQVPVSSTGKLIYKLEDKFSGMRKTNKTQGKDTKRLFIKGEIQSHDLQIKINQILKFLEKDLEVLCILEGDKEKLRGILSLLEDSQLKDHFKQKRETKRGLQLIYKKKSENNDKSKGKNEDDVASSKIES